jgi:bifunctional non-homologous end joining protein LigD
MPLTWEELDHAHPLDFRMDNVFERLERVGDRWQDALTAKQDITRSRTPPADSMQPSRRRKPTRN